MITLCQYADQSLLERLLIKERAKCCRKNKGRRIEHNEEDNLQEEMLTARQQLSLLMPPRESWVRPRRRKQYLQPDGKLDVKKYNAHCIKLTIERDRKSGDKPYLARLDSFCRELRKELQSVQIRLQRPLLKPLQKSAELTSDGLDITYRPLSVYTSLHDKIILSVGSHYLTTRFGGYLHDNILSYRTARNFEGRENVVTDFNDGVRLITEYMKKHPGTPLYAADCDIRKFYDGISHDVIRRCFGCLMDRAGVSATGRKQLNALIEAYLASYNFYDDVLIPAADPDFWNHLRPCKQKVASRHFDWLPEADYMLTTEKRKLGVAQGGSLSLMIADVVLNDVDMEAGLVEPRNSDMLFIRFCDDMVLLHTDRTKCEQLMKAYTESLEAHGLYYHPLSELSKFKDGERTGAGFWHAKSHHVFLWDKGVDATEHIGFLGYEINRNGMVRLRKSNTHKLMDKISRTRSAVLRHYWQKEKTDQAAFFQTCDKLFRTLAGSLGYYDGMMGQSLEGEQVGRLETLRIMMVRQLSNEMMRKNRELSDKEREAFAQGILKYADKEYAILPPGT